MRVLPPPAPPLPDTAERIINLAHPAVTPAYAKMLDCLKRQRESYLQQGRGREAHAVARSRLIVWHTIIATPGAEALIDTRPPPLDLLLP